MCHEILGHGSTQAYVGNKLFRDSIYITQRLEGETQLYELLGFSYEEAAADYIAHMAINKKLNNLSNGAIYAESLYFFLAMCEALDRIEKRGNYLCMLSMVNNYVRNKKLTFKAACEDLGVEYKEYMAAKSFIKRQEARQV